MPASHLPSSRRTSCQALQASCSIIMNLLNFTKCIPELRNHYTKSSWLHAHPFGWPTYSLAPFKTKNPWVTVHWYMNVTLAIIYFGFVVCRMLESYNDHSSSLDQKLYLVLLSVIYAAVVLFPFGMLLKSNDFIQFQRSHIKFIRDYVPNCLELVTDDGKTCSRSHCSNSMQVDNYWNPSFCREP